MEEQNRSMEEKHSMEGNRSTEAEAAVEETEATDGVEEQSMEEEQSMDESHTGENKKAEGETRMGIELENEQVMEEGLSLEKFEEASEIVKQVTLETKLVFSEYLSSQTGNKVYLKPENMQLTGAYKLRGAYYKICTLTDEERAKGLITASAGNHAQGVAYAAKAYGTKAVIVMPTTTPLMKVNRTKGYGAEVVLYGDVYDEACAKAYELAEENGYTFIHPFDDLMVATGQGTIAMEIVKELPLVDYILVPIGGGGLATGVATLAKLLNPKIKVIGVEPAGANCMQTSLAQGHVVTLPKVTTIADGTADLDINCEKDSYPDSIIPSIIKING